MAEARHAELGEGGGGKFNNVIGIIKSYEFTTVHPFAKNPPKRRKEGEFEPLFGVLTAQMDGATKPDVDVLLVGDANDFEVSEDGLTLTPAVEGGKVWKDGQWGKLIASLEEHGVSTESGDYERGVYNYTPIVNRRVRFKQVQQFDKNGKVKQREGKGRGGVGKKMYDDTTTVVCEDFGYAEVVKASAATSKSAAKRQAAGKTSKPAPSGVTTETMDEALVMLLDKFDGECPKAKIVSGPAQFALKKAYGEDADEIRRGIYDDEYLNDAVTRGVISGYDQTSKAQTISAVAVAA